MLKFIKKQLLYKEIKLKNFNQFSNIKKKTNRVVLIEFNSFQILHIIFAYLSNFFKDKKNLTIKAFYSHILLAYPFKRSLRQIFFSSIGEFFNINFF